MNLTNDELNRMELLEDRLLVVEQELPITPGGIQLISNDHKWDMYATVIKTGPGYKHIGMPVEVGQKIVIGKQAGQPVVFDLPTGDDGELKEIPMLVIRLSAVLGIVVPNSETTPTQ